MEFAEIDHQFDEAMERLRGKTPPAAAGAYGTSPLASDHFLLKRSWDYFRNRVRTIEEQWRKMLEAKDIQLKTSMVETQEMRNRALELEEDNRLLRSLDQNIKKARTEDFVGFARKAENLRLRWDAEREALQRKVDQLEIKVAQQKKEIQQRITAAQIREDSLRENAGTMKKEIATHADHEKTLQQRWMGELSERDEKILSLDMKMEVLRGEVERRDQLIKEFKATVHTANADAVAMTAYVTELQRMLKDKDTEIQLQKSKFDVLKQDNDNLRAGWERERAEWRELWDRGRDMWERKSPSRELK